MIERNIPTKNQVSIDGTLVDAKIETKNSKNGKMMAIGSITINVNDSLYEINCLSMKEKKDGTVRPLFNTLSTISSLFNKKVHAFCSLDENKFVNREGKLVKTQRIRLISLGTNYSGEDKATFNFSGFVTSPIMEVYDTDGVTVKDYTISLGTIDFTKTKAEVFKFNVDKNNMAAVDAIRNRMTMNTSVEIEGILDFNIETYTKEIENDFGPNTVKTYQKPIKRYVLVSGHLFNVELAYTNDEISELMAGTKREDNAILNGGTTQATAANISAPSPRLI